MTGAPAWHDDDLPWEPVAHRVVASWPAGTFVENIAPLPDGAFVLSVHNRSCLLRVTPDGTVSTLAEMPTSPTGLVVWGEDVHVTGGTIGTAPHAVFRVRPDGTVEHRLDVPDSRFLNGFTPLRPGLAATVDSLSGTVYEVDLATGSVRVVLHHDLLGKVSADEMMPGVNGLAVGDDALWLTNTDRALILRADLSDGSPHGTPEVAAEHLRGDDLAVDAHGALYVTTHPHNGLVRLDPDGRRVALAGPEQHMVGSTACAFGTGDERDALYVTTNGGMSLPLDGVVRPADLVRLEVGAPGRPLPA